LEGNDQYRGWFNASLILSVAYSGVAPFENCVTHGWVMDENWQKMSKSAGNGIDPTKVANQFGADLLRLWAATVNYETDVRISESLIQTSADQYRKIRNTFKFMLGNLQDGEKAYVQPERAPKLTTIDTWVLAELESVKNQALKDYANYHFASVSGALTNFLVGLSSFYLDYAKDSLYCDKADSEKRKGIQYVLYKLTYELCLLYNPILCFTMDEVYSYIPGHKKASPQLEDMPKESHEYGEDVLKEYEAFKSYRDQVLKALEEARAKGLIGASSEAELHLSFKDDGLRKLVKSDGRKRSRGPFPCFFASFRRD
jgi:isoleucyl-tRNA synthetase